LNINAGSDAMQLKYTPQRRLADRAILLGVLSLGALFMAAALWCRNGRKHDIAGSQSRANCHRMYAAARTRAESLAIDGQAATAFLERKVGYLRRDVRCGEIRYYDNVAVNDRSGPASPLAVLQPASGDIWIEGSSYTIRWRSNGVARVSVGLAIGGKDKGHVAFDLPSSIDSLRWEIPVGFISGFGLQRSDDARVRIEDAGDPTQFADSPSFTIVAQGH
jgi:hypothetical protein